MLQVAVRRLWHIWPSADIDIVTSAPDALNYYCPGTRAVPGRGRDLFFCPGSVLRGFGRLCPRVERQVRVRMPWFARHGIRLKKTLRGTNTADLQHFAGALQAADLVVATGGGYLCDPFAHHGTCALDTLLIAHRAGKPIALFGQGIGPLRDPVLVVAARETLRHALVIGIREGVHGLAALSELGVDIAAAVVTGDDALEVVRDSAGGGSGRDIGFNIRIAPYSGITESDSLQVVYVVTTFAAAKGVGVRGIPISYCPDGDDLVSLQRLNLLSAQSFECRSVSNCKRATPQEAIAEVGHCRIIVTGSYHAAVFALGQGVPAVCLEASDYYRLKFEGLQAQFGRGCYIAHLGDTAAPHAVDRLIETAWFEADAVRAHLIGAAQRQIDAGVQAYQRLSEVKGA